MLMWGFLIYLAGLHQVHQNGAGGRQQLYIIPATAGIKIKGFWVTSNTFTSLLSNSGNKYIRLIVFEES